MEEYRAFPVRLPSGVRYWTVVDGGLSGSRGGGRVLAAHAAGAGPGGVEHEGVRDRRWRCSSAGARGRAWSGSGLRGCWAGSCTGCAFTTRAGPGRRTCPGRCGASGGSTACWRRCGSSSGMPPRPGWPDRARCGRCSRWPMTGRCRRRRAARALPVPGCGPGTGCASRSARSRRSAMRRSWSCCGRAGTRGTGSSCWRCGGWGCGAASWPGCGGRTCTSCRTPPGWAAG